MPETIVRQSRRAPPVLRVERELTMDIYTGTREQLIAAGVVQDGQFPGDPGRGKTSVALLADGTAARRGTGVALRIYRQGKSRYGVYVPLSEEEEARRRAERKAERERERRIDDLRKMAPTPKEFVHEVSETFCSLAAGFTKLYLKRTDGYRMDEETLERFREAIAWAYWVVREGAVVGQSPRTKLQNLLFADARRDEKLQVFIEQASEAALSRREPTLS
jgi:hypothetical protein